MFGFSNKKILPIAVDFGVDSVRVLQLQQAGQALSVVAAARVAMPPEVRKAPELRLPLALDLARQLIRNNSFVGNHVVSALPRELVHSKNLRLPAMPEAEISAAVEFEGRSILPNESGEIMLRHIYAGEVRQGNDARAEVIAFAARQLEINLFVEQLHRMGLVVDALDVEPCALYRGVERFVRRREDEQEVHVLLDIGFRRSQVIIARGRQIQMFKPIDVGARQLHQAVGRKLSINDDEAQLLRRRLAARGEGPEKIGGADAVSQAVADAIRSPLEDLAREIALCLRYYSVTFRGQRVGRLRVMGGEACDPHVIETLAQALPVPVAPARPLNNIDTARMKPADRRGCLAEWSLVMGLALRRSVGTFAALDGAPRQQPQVDPANLAELSSPEVVHA